MSGEMEGLRIIAAMDCDCDRRYVGHGSHCPVGVAERALLDAQPSPEPDVIGSCRICGASIEVMHGPGGVQNIPAVFDGLGWECLAHDSEPVPASPEPDARCVVVIDADGEIMCDYLLTPEDAPTCIADLVERHGEDQRSRFSVLPVGTGPRVEPVGYGVMCHGYDESKLPAIGRKRDKWEVDAFFYLFQRDKAEEATKEYRPEARAHVVALYPDPAPRPAQEEDEHE